MTATIFGAGASSWHGCGQWLSLSASSGFSSHLFWLLGRSAGFVSYWLLFISVLVGLAVSSRVFDGWLGRAWVFELHKFISVFVLLVIFFHALVMLPDPYAGFSLRELLVPFQSHINRTPIALGIIAFYGSVIVSATFYLKGFIGQTGWRLIHYLTFACFVLALAHALLAGTDSGIGNVRLSYFVSGLTVIFLIFYRILATRSAPAARRPPLKAGAPQS